MERTGVLPMILPVPAAIGRLERLVAVAPGSDALLRLAGLIRRAVPEAEAARAVATGLRLSNAETRRLATLATAPLPALGTDPVAHRHGIYEQGAGPHRDLLMLAAASTGAGPERLAAALAAAAAAAPPRFPLTGADLLARGFQPGPALGRALDAARRHWEAADFTPDRAACLAFLDRAGAAAAIPP
jgi:poly(A) polymerase